MNEKPIKKFFLEFSKQFKLTAFQLLFFFIECITELKKSVFEIFLLWLYNSNFFKNKGKLVSVSNVIFILSCSFETLFIFSDFIFIHVTSELREHFK